MADLEYLGGLDDSKHLVRERSLIALEKALQEGARHQGMDNHRK
jgi:hypothetical protein